MHKRRMVLLDKERDRLDMEAVRRRFAAWCGVGDRQPARYR